MSGPPERSEKRIGPYLLASKLGQGGMGVVYLARHAELGRTVALKCLLGEAEGELLARFRREAEAAVRVVHPGLARLYDFGEDGSQVYMAMEYIRGFTLHKLIQEKGALPIDQVVDLARQLLRALEACHTAGLVHRDLKPANIMIDEQGVLKVMDLGLVHVPNRTMLTQEGQVMGTPRYWPPEMIQGESVDLRADLYQAGLIIHEMLTGRAAFHGIPIPELPAAILTRPLPPLPPLEGPVAPRIAEVLTRLLARERKERFTCARDAIAVLDRRTSSGVTSRKASGLAGGGRAASASGAVRVPPEASTAVQGEPARRTKLTSGQLGAGAGLVVLGLIFIGSRLVRPAPPQPGPVLTRAGAGSGPDAPASADAPRGASPRPSETGAPPAPPLSASEAKQLVEGLAGAVRYVRELGLSPELDDADARLKRLSSPAERTALTARLHARWRGLIGGSRFQAPVMRFQERAPEAWTSPHLAPEVRAELLLRVREIASLIAKLEQGFGLRTGFDLERFERPYLRSHAAGHVGAKPWRVWIFGDGGRASGRALPAFGVTPAVASASAVFSANDLDKLLAGEHRPLRRLTVALDHPLACPPGGALPTVHVSFRMSGGLLGEALLVSSVLPGTPAPFPLAALVPFSAVEEGCVEVDARLLTSATALELRMHGRPLGSIPRGLTIDYLAAWIVPAPR